MRLGGDIRFSAIGPPQLTKIADRFPIPADILERTRRLSLVFPFRTNTYVLTQLIDWNHVPDDPIFQLTFPQPGMLAAEEEAELARHSTHGTRATPELTTTVNRIRLGLNPHPSGQQELNVPVDRGGERLQGVQHKYRETVLYFPSNGQTCHAYCSYCFRWAQFIGDSELKFATAGPEPLGRYLADHSDVTDILFTGGDPLIMATDQLRRHVLPLLKVNSVETLRFGTKALAYWPRRFLSDPDAPELLSLFREIQGAGKNVAVMAHYSHPRELETDLAQQAVAAVLETGCRIYTQAPIMRHVNSDSDTWSRLWRQQLRLGMVPYYMFIARDTGGHDYFQVPLDEAHRIFTDSYRGLPGLARTVRGPVMSTTAGKVVVDGCHDLGQERVFSLRMLNARNPDLVGRPFFARHDPRASWLDELSPHPLTDRETARQIWGSADVEPVQPLIGAGR